MATSEFPRGSAQPNWGARQSSPQAHPLFGFFLHCTWLRNTGESCHRHKKLLARHRPRGYGFPAALTIGIRGGGGGGTHQLSHQLLKNPVILRTSEPLLPQGPQSFGQCRDLPHKHGLSGCSFCRGENGVFKRLKSLLQELPSPVLSTSPFGSSALPWPHPSVHFLLPESSLHLSLPPSAVSFAGMISLFAAACWTAAPVTPAPSKPRLPPCACCGTAALVVFCL